MYNNSNNFPGAQADPQSLQSSISYIQTNLRQLSYHDDDIYSVAIDGIWSEETQNSLRSFQRKYGLPETGVANFETWERLKAEADRSRRFHSPTEPIRIFPRYPADYFWDRESSPIHLQILQYVLRELETEYNFGDIQLSGIYDDATRSAVEKFQQKNGLTPTGVVDRVTWNRLAEHYNTIADISNR